MSADRFRVLIVIESLDGGSGRHAVDLALGLGARDHDVVFAYAPHRAHDGLLNELAAGRNVRVAPFRMERAVSPRDMRALVDLEKIVKQYGPFDVVHGQSSKGGAAARLMSAGGAKRVYTSHAFRTMDPTIRPGARMFYNTMERALATRTDALIAGSQREWDHALRVGLPEKKLHKIVNGMWPPTGQPDAITLRMEAGIPMNAVCVGFVGRFEYQKYPQMFVRAFARASAELNGVAPYALMVGDGSLRPDVEHEIAKAGLGDHVKLLGAAAGLRWMPAFDILAMSSRYEAMPYVYIEALFNSLPIITTDVGGAVEAVAPGVNGVITPTLDEEAFANALTSLIRDQQLRQSYAEASRERANDFHMDLMIDRNLAVYRDVTLAA